MVTKKKKLESSTNPLNIPTFPSVAEQLKTAAQPKPTAQVQTPPNPTPTINKVLTDVKTGQPSGFELNGKTFLGAKPQEIAQTQKNLEARNEPTKQLLAINEQAQQAEAALQQQLLGQQLAGRVGMISPDIVNQAQAGGIDLKQALGVGMTATLPGVIGGAIAGAPVAGVGALPGAVVGGVGGFLVGVRGNIKSQKSGSIKAGAGALTDGESNLRNLINAANANPGGAMEYYAMFNEQLSYIERDKGSLHLDTSGFLKDLSGADGTPQIAEYERFDQFTKPLLIQQMQLALLNPDPSKNLVTPEEMLE